MLVIPNQNLFNMSNERTSLMDAFRFVAWPGFMPTAAQFTTVLAGLTLTVVGSCSLRMADNVLLDGVKNISDLMVMPGLINLDFADVQSVRRSISFLVCNCECARASLIAFLSNL
jgi:cell division protein FtsZ